MITTISEFDDMLNALSKSPDPDASVTLDKLVRGAGEMFKSAISGKRIVPYSMEVYSAVNAFRVMKEALNKHSVEKLATELPDLNIRGCKIPFFLNQDNIKQVKRILESAVMDHERYASELTNCMLEASQNIHLKLYNDDTFKDDPYFSRATIIVPERKAGAVHYYNLILRIEGKETPFPAADESRLFYDKQEAIDALDQTLIQTFGIASGTEQYSFAETSAYIVSINYKKLYEERLGLVEKGKSKPTQKPGEPSTTVSLIRKNKR